MPTIHLPDYTEYFGFCVVHLFSFMCCVMFYCVCLVDCVSGLFIIVFSNMQFKKTKTTKLMDMQKNVSYIKIINGQIQKEITH